MRTKVVYFYKTRHTVRRYSTLVRMYVIVYKAATHDKIRQMGTVYRLFDAIFSISRHMPELCKSVCTQ